MNQNPKDLNEAINILYFHLNNELDSIARTPINEYIKTEQFGLGRFLRNEWNLNSGSELQIWFNQIGINHSEDMSNIILTSFHRKLNNIPIDLDGQINTFKIYWNIHNSEK